MSNANQQAARESGGARGAAGGDGAASGRRTPEVSRPALRYHGGKWRLAPWIIGHFPPHRCYVEPFGGAASVLLRKAPVYSEVYNDLNREVVNFFRVLRDRERCEELCRQLRLTPFSRAEFERAWEPAEGRPVEHARRLVVRSFMGFSTVGVTGKVRGASRTGFRASAHRMHKIPAHYWNTYPGALDAFTERLAGVVIEERDAFEVIEQQDRRHTLHYIDPPYLRETRGKWGEDAYAHEMDDAGHEELAALLHGLDGMVVLSGYPSELYRQLYEERGWECAQRVAMADGARQRTECLYLNPAAQQRQPQQSLFS